MVAIPLYNDVKFHVAEALSDATSHDLTSFVAEYMSTIKHIPFDALYGTEGRHLSLQPSFSAGRTVWYQISVIEYKT